MIKLTVLALVLFLCRFCLAENKGFCPPPGPMNLAPSKRADRPTSTDPDKTYFGTVTLVAVVSDRGYICSVRVTHGINKELDEKTEMMVKDGTLTLRGRMVRRCP